jgi:hypothetical protein
LSRLFCALKLSMSARLTGGHSLAEISLKISTIRDLISFFCSFSAVAGLCSFFAAVSSGADIVNPPKLRPHVATPAWRGAARSTSSVSGRYNGSSSLPWRSRVGVAMSPSSKSSSASCGAGGGNGGFALSPSCSSASAAIEVLRALSGSAEKKSWPLGSASFGCRTRTKGPAPVSSCEGNHTPLRRGCRGSMTGA